MLFNLFSGSPSRRFAVVALAMLGLLLLLSIVGFVQVQQFVEAQQQEQEETLDEDDEQPDPDNERVQRYRAARDAALNTSLTTLGIDAEAAGGDNVLQGVAAKISRGWDDKFSVRLYGLDSSVWASYELIVLTSSTGLSLRSDCETKKITENVSGTTDHISYQTAYGCRAGTYTLKVKLYEYYSDESGHIMKTLLDTDSEKVRVVEPPTPTPTPPPPTPTPTNTPTPTPTNTPTPTPTNTPTPTPTNTPTPTPTNIPIPKPIPTFVPPTGLISTARSIDGASKFSDIAKMNLDWDDVPGEGVTYEVQQKKPRWGPIPDGWETLLDGFTVSGVVIGGLEFGKEYHHRVRAFRDDQVSNWSEEHPTTVPIPFLGHQGDHTVKYKKVWVSASAEPPPAADVAVFSTAIASAADEWNEAVFYVVTPPPHVLFCEGNECMSSSVDRNKDGRTITIYVGAVSCGSTVACIGPAFESDHDYLVDLSILDYVATDWFDEYGHMKDLQMRIEEPATYKNPFTNEVTPFYWTNDPDLHRRKHDSGDGIWYYLPAMPMHEFGHAAGLHDLHLYDGSPKGKYSGHVMLAPEYKERGIIGFFDRIVPYTSIPDKDRDHLLHVYRNHTTH